MVDKSLEEVLDDIRNNPTEKDTFKKEIPIFKKYITHLFLEISDQNNLPGNNYATFFRCLNNICDYYFVVNFNYDLLAQKAIQGVLGVEFDSITSYIKHKIKLIQPHGSVLWKWEGGDITIGGTKSDGAEIVIPTTSGKQLVCPSDHIDLLINYLRKEVNVIIIIGWKGTEDHFKEILNIITTPPRRLILVGGSKEPNEKILKNCGLSRFSNIERIYVQGFSNLLKKYPDFDMDFNTDELF